MNNKEMKKILKTTINNRKPLKITMIVLLLLFILLIFRLSFLQFIQGDELKRQASSQQTSTRTIKPTRGTIYDLNGKLLAVSAEVDSVSVNPKNLKNSDDEEVNKEFVAQSFSDIFGLDYTKLLETLNTADSYTTIASKVEHDKIDTLKDWMKTNEIYSGIKIDSSIKRYYPYDNLASQVIGFTGTDNNGLVGLENSLESILAGTAGQVVTLTDSVNDEIPNQQKSYIEPQNGSNIYLTIDVNIQSIAEKYLSQAVIDNKADYGTVIIMEPSTGNILAMCNYPDYNLNTPFTPITSYWQERWDTLSSTDKTEMYRNIMVSSRYEPGSTFKLINAAIALEENITDTDVTDEFNCIGYETFGTDNDITTIKCGSSVPHGKQTLRQVLQNSCNPGMMQLASRIGTRTFYKYYNAFGLFNKTNINLPEEINSDFFKEERVYSVDLATMGFGQRISVTPIQLITAISAIANDGVLMKPRMVKEIINTETNAVTNIKEKEVRQVISSETANKMLDMMESVVTEGRWF